MSELQPGDSLGHYRILRELGRGGNGVVYLAQDTSLNDMEVALKVLHNSILRERLLAGAQAAVQLSHPHIQQIFEQGIDETTDTAFVATEYLPGGSLRDRIGKLSMGEALLIFSQICSAAAHCHQNQIIHRDFKPGNIMFNSRGDAVVIDFDMVRIQDGRRITIAGTVIGTPYYISPEQALGKKDIDHTTDIYALGVMLYEMLTGTWPMTGETRMDILLAHLRRPVPDIMDENPDIPEVFNQIIKRAMAKDPEERYQDANQLAIEATRIMPRLATPQSEATTQQLAPIKDEALYLTAPGAQLHVLNGSQTDQLFTVNQEASLGRHPKCDIVLDDIHASSTHARIAFKGDRYWLRDVNSTNGTWVGKIKLAPYVPHPLEADDVIRIGNTRIAFIL